MRAASMKSGVLILATVGVMLVWAPAGSASDGQVANVAEASSIVFTQDNNAIKRALKRLDLRSLSSVDALVETGFSMEHDMRTHAKFLTMTKASTNSGRLGRALLLRGLTALAASGEYMLRYGRALGSNASLGVLQVDSDGYRVKAHEGVILAQKGAALLGVSFG